MLKLKSKISDKHRYKIVKKLYEKGKLTARERINYLCDEFFEIGKLASPYPLTPEVFDWDRKDAPADGVITGFGKIHDRFVGIIATVLQ